MRSTSSERRSLLVVGHPGHELRVHRWIERAAPVVCILTDGSGRDSAPRLCESLALLQGLGAQMGPLCGEFSDRQVYTHILDQNCDFFVSLCERLTEVIVTQGIDMVVSDAMEGYNPTHDLCEVLARSAVTLANQQKSEHTQHYAFPLIGDPRPSKETDQSTYLEIKLSASQLQQKLGGTRVRAARRRHAASRSGGDAGPLWGKGFLAGIPVCRPATGSRSGAALRRCQTIL